MNFRRTLKKLFAPLAPSTLSVQCNAACSMFSVQCSMFMHFHVAIKHRNARALLKAHAVLTFWQSGDRQEIDWKFVVENPEKRERRQSLPGNRRSWVGSGGGDLMASGANQRQRPQQQPQQLQHSGCHHRRHPSVARAFSTAAAAAARTSVDQNRFHVSLRQGGWDGWREKAKTGLSRYSRPAAGLRTAPGVS